jgi:hypothetical protein
VLTATRILVLVQGGAVEAPQRKVVLGEMCGNPIDDHTYAVLMAIIDEEAKVVGSAVARGWREVTRHLIAPGRKECVLRDGHQFDVSKAEALYVLHQTRRELTIGQPAISLFWNTRPRAGMHFVNAERLTPNIAPAARLHPRLVAP